jgi:hypothetical protein
MGGKNECNSHTTIKYYTLLLTGFDNSHITPCDKQQRKYAEVGYSKYVKDNTQYIQDGVYVAKGLYSKYAEDGVYVAKGEYSKNAEEDASVKEGHNKPLTKEGNNKPLAKDGNWLGMTMSSLPQVQLAACVMQDDNEPLATKGLMTAYTVQGNDKPLTTIGDWATTFDDSEGAKVLTIKLIMLIVISYHCN